MVWRSSGAAVAPRLTMLATMPSQSDFGRREATIRVRSWQVTQRDSTRSLPGPAGNEATIGGGAPAAGGELGPKLVVKFCTMVLSVWHPVQTLATTSRPSPGGKLGAG